MKPASPPAAAKPPVVPGLGAVPPSHVATGAGIVAGVAQHTLANPAAPQLHQLAQNALHDPTRWGTDPARSQALAREGRLPSQILSPHPGRFREQLVAAHEQHGRDLRMRAIKREKKADAISMHETGFLLVLARKSTTLLMNCGRWAVRSYRSGTNLPDRVCRFHSSNRPAKPVTCESKQAHFWCHQGKRTPLNITDSLIMA